MINFVFFGSSEFSVLALDELLRLGFKPKAVVTTPDKPQGRKMTLTPTPVKAWAEAKGVKVYDPAKLDDSFAAEMRNEGADLFVVASYGKIIPGKVIDIPPRKTLNIHPSLLPKYRGASPLQSAMLDDAKKTGVTIMQIDEQMDHGPIVAQNEVRVSEWPTYEEFEAQMAVEGAKLLASIMPKWVAGEIEAKPQSHEQATYTRKIVKEDGLIDLSADPYLNFRKIQAFHAWPQAFFFIKRDGRDLRVKITRASFSNGVLNIEKVIPEGSKEMTFSDFKKGYSAR